MIPPPLESIGAGVISGVDIGIFFVVIEMFTETPSILLLKHKMLSGRQIQYVNLS